MFQIQFHGFIINSRLFSGDTNCFRRSKKTILRRTMYAPLHPPEISTFFYENDKEIKRWKNNYEHATRSIPDILFMAQKHYKVARKAQLFPFEVDGNDGGLENICFSLYLRRSASLRFFWMNKHLNYSREFIVSNIFVSSIFLIKHGG